jgi:hypothetical protein
MRGAVVDECMCVCTEKIFITGQNEREETTQDTIVTKSAAYASYKSNYVTMLEASSVV